MSYVELNINAILYSSVVNLINREQTLEYKLDLLTAISITSTDEEVFNICEGLRDTLVHQTSSETGKEGSELLQGIP
jgi:hypothetical protein